MTTPVLDSSPPQPRLALGQGSPGAVVRERKGSQPSWSAPSGGPT